MPSKVLQFWAGLAALLVGGRMCHTRILWEGDTLPLAAAAQMLHGKALYGGIWFDKPPLVAAFHLLCGAVDGWPLRLLGALYAVLACWLIFELARRLWSAREGFWAAGLLAFYLTFGVASAVIPVASDLMLLAPHLAAVWMAMDRRPFASGLLVGVAFAVSPKAVFVAAVCALWYPAGIPMMAAGFAVASGVSAAWLWGTGSLAAYINEVWVWGRLYAASSPFDAPWRN